MGSRQAARGDPKKLARFSHVAESTVSKYLSGERIAPAEFVDALLAFRAIVTDGAVAERVGETAPVHALRAKAEDVGSAKTQLRQAKEQIQELEKQLEAAKAAINADAAYRVKELQEQLSHSKKEIDDLSKQLHRVQEELQAERDRGRKAALANSVASTALVVKGLDGVTRAARPTEEIDDEQKMVSELLVLVTQLQQQASRLSSDGPGSLVTQERDAVTPWLRERDGLLFRHLLPVRICTVSATLSACVILNVDVASFVVTWRSDAGLTIAQLIAYIILVFPLTLILSGLLFGFGVFLAHGHSDDFGKTADSLALWTGGAALLLGISGPFFLPPLTWVGHAWAVYIGIL